MSRLVKLFGMRNVPVIKALPREGVEVGWFVAEMISRDKETRHPLDRSLGGRYSQSASRKTAISLR
jgi:hypothetical protein